MFPKSLENHPIWSKVIAGLITAVMLYAVSFIPGFYHAIWIVIKGVAEWLVAPGSAPHWVFVLLYIAAVVLFFKGLVRLFAHTVSPGPTVNDYTKDMFWGITWRWRYSGGDIWQVAPFCPRCDMEIHPSREYGDYVFNKPEGTRFPCDGCHGFDKIVPIVLASIQDAVIREIQRKIRTGEWQSAVTDTQISERHNQD